MIITKYGELIFVVVVSYVKIFVNRSIVLLESFFGLKRKFLNTFTNAVASKIQV